MIKLSRQARNTRRGNSSLRLNCSAMLLRSVVCKRPRLGNAFYIRAVLPHRRGCLGANLAQSTDSGISLSYLGLDLGNGIWVGELAEI
jgi:hypothetical protein